jgi:hypothetical protein
VQQSIFHNPKGFNKRILCGRSALSIVVLILTTFLVTCKDIPRDNPLDPKNPSSTRPQKVLIEAFVNTNDSIQININNFALAALDTLKSIYPTQLIILEYHRNTRDYTDPYHSIENETLYQHYISQFNSFAGVPDIFINGTVQRVQGASSTANSIIRLSNALGETLNQNSEFSIEIKYQKSSSAIVPTVRVARLGSNDARDIIVKGVLLARLDGNSLKRVVRDISLTRINVIEHGTFQTVALEPLTIRETPATYSLVVIVMDGAESEVFQCETVEIP